jgi:hypothetical protein
VAGTIGELPTMAGAGLCGFSLVDRWFTISVPATVAMVAVIVLSIQKLGPEAMSLPHD